MALKFVEPVLKTSIGRTTYADQRAMESVVSGSGLDWTVVRPSGLFDLDHVADYLCRRGGSGGGPSPPARPLRTTCWRWRRRHPGHRRLVTISTVADTPTLWNMVRREAFTSA